MFNIQLQKILLTNMDQSHCKNVFWALMEIPSICFNYSIRVALETLNKPINATLLSPLIFQRSCFVMRNEA